MIAPSYQKTYEILSEEPYFKNGKYYVLAKHKNTENEREIRWYSDSEYAKQYGKNEKQESNVNYKVARGFEKGPILVVRHNKNADEEWLRRSIARYAMGVGWYIASTDTLPDNYPPHFKFLLLGWNEVSVDGNENTIKEPKEVAKILDEKARKKEWVDFK